MWFVYILRSLKDDELYIGATNDVRRRLSEHNSARVDSTKGRTRFRLEAYINGEMPELAEGARLLSEYPA